MPAARQSSPELSAPEGRLEALSLILDFEENHPVFLSESNQGGWASGMAVYVGEQLLQHSEERQFTVGIQTIEAIFNLKSDGNFAAGGESIRYQEIAAFSPSPPTSADTAGRIWFEPL